LLFEFFTAIVIKGEKKRDKRDEKVTGEKGGRD